jgi:DNA-binding transcriptional ArsR family regulator
MTNNQPALDRVFQALSDPTRRAIVQRLSRGAATVSELRAPFSMALPTLLQHLRILEASGLIGSAKVGRVRTCTMRPAAFGAAEAWLAARRAAWEARLDRMEAYVAGLAASPHDRTRPVKIRANIRSKEKQRGKSPRAR